jgi:ribosomal protein S18 acetylase RimI-like enzyme
MNSIEYKSDADLETDQVLALYRSLNWSSADKPDLLMKALQNSHAVVTAWDGHRLVGLGNAISDGHLVVYFPHLAVQPDYQGRGIGTEIVRRMQKRYAGFHQQTLVADGRAVDFYKKLGFCRAGQCQALWIYDGHDHG